MEKPSLANVEVRGRRRPSRETGYFVSERENLENWASLREGVSFPLRGKRRPEGGRTKLL